MRTLNLVWECVGSRGAKSLLEEWKSELTLKIGEGASQWKREEEKNINDRE